MGDFVQKISYSVFGPKNVCSTRCTVDFEAERGICSNCLMMLQRRCQPRQWHFFVPFRHDSGLEGVGFEKNYFWQKTMAHAVNNQQGDMKNCLIVCQTMGEVDNPAWLIQPSSLNVKLFYNNLDRVLFETVAYKNDGQDARHCAAANKADAMRLFDYKSSIGPNRA